MKRKPSDGRRRLCCEQFVVMKLSELKRRVDNAIDQAIDQGGKPDEVLVSLQIDGPDEISAWGSDGLELHYDNNGMAAGCVLHCIRES